MNQHWRGPLLFLFAFVGCRAVGDLPPESGLLYQGDAGNIAAACPQTSTAMQLEMFASRCAEAACHDRDNPAMSLDLVSPELEQRLVGAPSLGCRGEMLVVPGQPELSELFRKVAHTQPECGLRMPVATASYSEQEIACLAAWIEGLPPTQPSTGDAGIGSPTADAREDAAADPSLSCPSGQNVCGSVCLDLQTNNNNCGSCGRACSPGSVCSGGTCTCAAGLALCTNACVDTRSSETDCGGCGQSCAGGQICLDGRCACSTGLMACGGTCVDATGDPDHCGDCGKRCTRGTVCAGGSCVRGGCPSGTTTCGSACVDTTSSALHCGGCNQACPSGQICSGASCTCPSGSTACGNTCIDTSSDPLNCGGCGLVCAAGQACSNGACGCSSGTATCGSVCADLASDPANCGGCGQACSPGNSCSNGVCVSSCASGTTLCGGSCVNTQTDPQNCGGCGRTCASGDICFAGTCQGCGGPVSFANQVQPIFNADCTSNCHSGNRPAANLSLESGAAYTELVNVVSTCGGRKHVAPGSPSTSYLMNKITGEGMCSGGIMPKMGGELSASQIELIRAWICQGAPNN